MIYRKHANRDGLPEWPSVDDSKLGVIVVSGKLRDPDVLEAKARKFGTWIIMFAGSMFFLNYQIYRIVFYLPVVIYKDPIFGLKCIGYILLLCFVLGILFSFATYLGRGFNALLFWIRSSVVLEFTSEGIEILSPSFKKGIYKLRSVPKIEFHAAPHPKQKDAKRVIDGTWEKNPSPFRFVEPSTKYLDAYVVNLVYGMKLVRLLSTHEEEQANDFVACCRWAAARAWFGRGGDCETIKDSPNDDDHDLGHDDD